MFYLNDEVDTPVRFDMLNFFDNSGDWYDPLNSFFAENLPKLNYVGEYIVTYEEKRPDLLSYNLYEDTQYWWIIMWYNSILNINDLVSGTIIKYPSKAAIEDLYINASTYKKVMKE